MPTTPNTGGASLSVTFIAGSVIEDLLDLFEPNPKKPSSAADSLQATAFENAINTSMEIASGKGRVVTVLRVAVLGLKVIKLVFGDDAGGETSFFYSLDQITAPGNDATSVIREKLRELSVQGAAAGLVMMDPVWLGDP